MSAGRRGGVLVLAVLILVLLELLAHGALVTAMGHARASDADRRLLEARAAARGAVLAIPGSVAGDTLDTLPAGAAVTGTWPRGRGSPADWTLSRLSAEGWVGEGRAAPGDAGWPVREARLFWRLSAEARVAALAAAAEVGDLRLGDLAGTVTGWEGGGCPAADGAGDEGAPGAILPPAGIAPWRRWPPPAPDTSVLGLLGWEALLDGVSVRVTGSGTPAPRHGEGICVDDHPWNWGDPEGGPESPCGGHQGWRAAPGDLRVVGGVGQGVLVALGDVELAGTRFHGLLLVAGDLTLGGGASLEGAARVGGRLKVGPAARLTGSPCPVLEALQAAPPALRTLRLRPGVGWLPLP